MTFDPAVVRARREQMLLRMLIRTTHVMNAEMAERVRARGYPGFQPSFTPLLAHTDTEGTSISTLARRLGTSRQAVSQLLHPIERMGLIERKPDPRDRRTVVVSHTAKGRQILVDAIAVMTEIETEYVRRIGEESMTKLKRGLKKLLAEVDPAGDLGTE